MPCTPTDNLSSRYLGVHGDSGQGLFLTPETEEPKSLLSEALLFEENDVPDYSNTTRPTTQPATLSKHSSLRFVEAKRPNSSLQRSSSDHHVHTRARQRHAAEAFRVGGNGHVEAASQLRGPRGSQSLRSNPKSTLRRTSSSPLLEIKPRHGSPEADPARLQHRLAAQTRHDDVPPPRPWRVRRVRTTTAPASPGFKWFPVQPSLDGSSIPQLQSFPIKRGRDLPLKPCMKQKSRSAATTPPHVRTGEIDAEDAGKLRRVKTVDFEETVSRKLEPLLNIWTDDLDPELSSQSQRLKPQVEESNAVLKSPTRKLPTCPGLKTKGRPADTAITRTDVHILAISPSWRDNDIPEEYGVEPVTPTTQFVETKAGCYEVLWDDGPPDYDIQNRRCSSSTNLSSSTGLERVNSKLTEWSWVKDGPSGSVKPQTVLSQNEGSRAPQFDCAVDDEDLIIVAPPNSERTSGNASGYPSHSTSARVSRAPSSDEYDFEMRATNGYASEKRDPQRVARVVPDSETSNKFAGYRIGASRGVRKPLADRRLSSMEDTDIHFRGHRDSVALARSRNADAGGVSQEGIRPELFMHRDSVSMAKKRIQSRNHATSAAYEIPCSKSIASDPMPTIDDSDDSDEPEPVTPKKQTALEGLKSSASASMLAPQPSKNHRHIRILE